MTFPIYKIGSWTYNPYPDAQRLPISLKVPYLYRDARLGKSSVSGTKMPYPISIWDNPDYMEIQIDGWDQSLLGTNLVAIIAGTAYYGS